MKLTYTHTRIASYTGYTVQAIVNNLPPLLYAIFHEEFGISLTQLGALISVNFLLQITVDLLSAVVVGKLGYRTCAVFSHLCSAAGILCMSILPYVLSPFGGLVISTILMGIGGGMIEVVLAPIIEALPSSNKSGGMALLHSFYCWGQAAVVLFSTLLLHFIGGISWRILPLLWATVPAVNGLIFLFVPILMLEERGVVSSFRDLFSSRLFYLFGALMLCAGASEMAVSQWSSYFAEIGLGLNKVVGDVAGPCAFAILMGLGRMLYSLFGQKISLPVFLTASGILCTGCYLVIALSPNPYLSLVACALCGLGVSMMWPGVYSMAAGRIPRGGSGLFALLAFAGDVGCALSPSLVGPLSGNTDAGLGHAFLVLATFPILFFLCSLILLKKRKVLTLGQFKEEPCREDHPVD